MRLPSYMRVLIKLSVFLALSACETRPSVGPAVRLAAGASDTIIINSRRPTPLAVHALDAEGGIIKSARVSYARVDGDPLPLDSLGVITCTRRGDLAVRAALANLTTRVFVLCRPVEYVRLQGPLQFILGDSEMDRPLLLPVAAYAADGHPVVTFSGRVDVVNNGVAELRGLTLYPQSRGITRADAYIGDRAASVGVHIYQRVSTLAALDTVLRVNPGQRLFAVPLGLESGELLRQRLPRGNWLLTMLPEQDPDPYGMRLRIEGASCQANIFNSPRRFACSAGSNADVIIYRSFRKNETKIATGYLLVRWLFT